MVKRVLVVCGLLIGLVGCAREAPPMPPLSSVVLAAPQRVVVVGDSYTSDDLETDRGWPAMAFEQLSSDPKMLIDPVVAAEGGAGYARDGIDGGRFLSQASTAVLPSDNLVVFFGSRNDAGLPIDQVQLAVDSTLGQVKDRATAAKLLIIGPAVAGGNPLPSVLAVRDVVRDEATKYGATFVDPLAEEWLYDPAMVNADGIHPNEAGLKYLADKIAPLIKQELQPGSPSVP